MIYNQFTSTEFKVVEFFNESITLFLLFELEEAVSLAISINSRENTINDSLYTMLLLKEFILNIHS